MDTMLESKIESLESRINALEASNEAWKGWDISKETEDGGAGSFEIHYTSGRTEYSVPVHSSISLPQGLKAETVSGSTVITLIEQPDYTIDEASLNNINALFFEFLIGAGAMVCLGLFVYYIRYFLFYFLIPKK